MTPARTQTEASDVARPGAWRLSDYHYDLPPALIAQQPAAERTASRLLTLDGRSGALADRRFQELPDLLQPGDLLVYNDTRVLAARLLGRKATGGRIEILVERILGPTTFCGQLRSSKGARAGQVLQLAAGATAVVLGKDDDLVRFELDRPVAAYLEHSGDLPLPPYIDRAATAVDRERYQTVFAAVPGAVAAPTAGLHFDAALLAALAGRGVSRAPVTLHVGAGTFQPVRVADIREHRLHAEWLNVPETTVAAIESVRAQGGRVVAVGTTVVRSLEAAAASGRLEAGPRETRIFIHPGYRFRVVDALITNFHLPESTLLMLVAAFAGREQVLAAYAHAVRQEYRFFSYGDAMLVTPAAEVRA